MITHRTNWALSVVVLILGLTGAGLLTVPIDRHRQSLGLTFNKQIDQAVPPWIMLSTTALGSFRGLALDVLWYRSRRLQDEGKYFEANQLAHWITTLQPRFPQVWSHQAWNMAYNISVATHTPEERWDWVNKGIALLRDKGIVYNPTAVRLYRELSWIFFHKFGKFMDDMHWYYRRQLATQWQELLGDLPLDLTTEQVIDRFRVIVNAPETITELVNREPTVEKFLSRLNELGYKPGQTLLRQIGRVQMQAGLQTARAATTPAQTTFGQKAVDLELAASLADPRMVGSVQLLLCYLRKQVLREDYHMDPAFMLELMERYGPMDWRHPASHGCYWSELGVKMASMVHGSDVQLERMTEIDLLNTSRQTIYAMQELTRSGRISLDPLAGHLDLMPDPRFVPAYSRAVDVARQHIESGAFGNVGTEGFDVGRENFLLEVMTIDYLYGEMERAKNYYKEVRDLYGHKSHNRANGRYRKPIGEFVADYLRDNLNMMSNTSQFIRAMLGRAFDRGLAYNQSSVFDRFVALAKMAHEQYQRDKQPSPTAARGRLSLLSFDKLLAETYLSYMQSRDIPLLKRSRVWSNTPLRLKQRVDDRLLPVLRQHAKQDGFVPERMFPLPRATVPVSRREAKPQPAATQRAPVQIERH